VNALDAVSPELVLVSPQLGRPDAAAEGLADSILAGRALSEHDLARLLAAQMGLPFVDLEHSTIDPHAAALLSEDDARMYSALPIALVDGRALVAVARPTNEPAIRRVAEKLGRDVDIAVAARRDLLRAIQRANGHPVEPLPPPPLPEPEPEAQPQAEPEPIAEPEPVAEPQPEPEPLPPAAVVAKPKPKPKPSAPRPRRRLRRRLLVAGALLLAAPMTALAGNVAAQALEDGPQTYVVRATPVARPLPGPEEWAWPGGEAGGELPLSRAFLLRLERAARRAHVEPSLLRAAIRARRGGGSPNLKRIARRLRGRDPWLALLALEGRTGYADRALALTRYYRATNVDGPPTGVRATPELRRQLSSGLVDPRLVALAGYLGQALGGVRLTSVTEPRLELAAPLADAHAQGRAIAIDVEGEDAKGSRLARSVRELLALPRELQPTTLVSTLRLGKPAELHLAF
jgi:outer membrane biosynthesis protein TonB